MGCAGANSAVIHEIPSFSSYAEVLISLDTLLSLKSVSPLGFVLSQSDSSLDFSRRNYEHNESTHASPVSIML